MTLAQTAHTPVPQQQLRWVLDSTRVPILVLRAFGGQPGDVPDLQSLFDLYEKIQAIPGAKAVVWDLERAKSDAKRRKEVTDWMRGRQAAKELDVTCLALIAPTSIQRGLVTAVLWFVRPAIPTQVFSNYTAAMQWAREQMTG